MIHEPTAAERAAAAPMHRPWEVVVAAVLLVCTGLLELMLIGLLLVPRLVTSSLAAEPHGPTLGAAIVGAAIAGAQVALAFALTGRARWSAWIVTAVEVVALAATLAGLLHGEDSGWPHLLTAIPIVVLVLVPPSRRWLQHRMPGSLG